MALRTSLATGLPLNSDGGTRKSLPNELVPQIARARWEVFRRITLDPCKLTGQSHHPVSQVLTANPLN